MAKNRKKLVLLDSHAIIHRAFHALPDFQASTGEPTGALYGVASMLLKAITTFHPDYIIAAYDLPQKTFRHDAYTDYKAKRMELHDALKTQLQTSRQIFDAFDIPIYDAPGFEADDIIGTITEVTKKEKDLDVIIVTGDMDTLQLVDKTRVTVFTLKKGLNDTVTYDEKGVEDRFGFSPKSLPDYKALRGDPSDNIIGVPGIGEKTGQILIQAFSTIEKLYDVLHKKGGEESIKKVGVSDRIVALLKEHEENAFFSKMLASIRLDAPIAFALPKKTFTEAVDVTKIEKLFQHFEFRSLIPRLKTTFGVSEEKKSEEIVATDREVLEAGIALWLLDSDKTTPTAAEICAFAKTDSFPKAYKDIFERLKKDKALHKVYEEIEAPIIPVIEEMERYGVLIDKKYFTSLSKNYHAQVKKLEQKIYALAGEEFNINSPKQLSAILFDKLKLPAGRAKKNISGGRSTRGEILEVLAETYPIAQLMLEYRELFKLLSTYIDTIPTLVGSDGRLHAKFLQHGTTTGRFSSQQPNLQNIPIKSDVGKAIRSGFIAPKGSVLLACDYSQIELRVLAMLSGDEKLIEIFTSGQDVHTSVASRMYGVPPKEVTHEMRRRAKVINFGIIYGMGVSALQKNLESTREEAETFLKTYFETFTKVTEYLEATKTFALSHRYSETLFGRRRKFPLLSSRLPYLISQALRMATNAPIQGTEADIIKLAMRYVDEDIKKSGLSDKVHLVLQIHDELVYEIDESVIEEARAIITKGMEGVLLRSYLQYKTPVPIVAHVGIGNNLEEVK